MKINVITYQGSGFETINLTEKQVAMLEAAGKWPKDHTGQEYASVSHGWHYGTPSLTDDELRENVGM